MLGNTSRRRVARAAAAVVGVLIGVLPLTTTADAAPTATRISGPDRYATSAAISAQSFSPGVNAAFVATGETFPDALAGTPAAAKAGGPVLLTQRDALPASVATELNRLDPGRIVVLGGTAAVSDAVLAQLDQLTDGTVTRISGANRFETAAAVSAATFPASTDTVYVATGANFPDALAGGPVAAKAPGGGGPILLVEQNAVPAATQTELQRLAADKVVILGGTGAVSDTVKGALEAVSDDPVARLSGGDRYDTAIEISKSRFSSASKVYLATGRTFPDALAGGPVAGIAGAPVLLTDTACMPQKVKDEIARLNPAQLIVLGGTGAVSDAAMQQTACVGATACNHGGGPAAANTIANLFCDRRASLGLAMMRRTAALDQVAQAWANHMAQVHQDPPPHNPNAPTQVLAACTSCTSWAENVGFWQSDNPTGVWNLWLSSGFHKGNIEHPAAGEFGVGVAYSPDGWLWIVHNFGRA